MDRGVQAVVISSSITGVAGLFLGLRCVVRFWVLKASGLEDWLLLAAMGLSIALTATIDEQREYGLGKHAVDVPPENNVMLLKILYGSVIVYNTGLLLVKFSLLCQYLRFFVDQKWRLACYIVMAVVAAGGLCIVTTAIFVCTPISLFWNKELNGTCLSIQALWYFYGGFQLITDLACWALPIPVLRKLALPRRQKYPLILAFTLGLFGCTVGALRLHYLYEATISTDLTYDNVAAATWSAIELNVGIVCACIPALRPLLGRVSRRLAPSYVPKSSQNTTLRSSSPGQTAAIYSHSNDSTIELSRTLSVTKEVSESGSPRLETTPDDGIQIKREWSIVMENAEEGRTRER